MLARQQLTHHRGAAYFLVEFHENFYFDLAFSRVKITLLPPLPIFTFSNMSNSSYLKYYLVADYISLDYHIP